MASPVVAGTNESATTTAGTSHTVNLPASISAGDLLIVILDKGSTAATVNSLSGWTELLDENNANGLYIAWRKADGSEGATITLTTSANTRSAEITYRITGAEDPTVTPPAIGTTATGTSVNPNPPSVTPPSSKDYLFIALFGMAGEQADDDTLVTTFPTNYSHSTNEKTCGVAGTNLGGMIGAASRQLTTGSAEDPGTFTAIDNAAWRAQTIIVHPPPPFTAYNITAATSTETAATAIDWAITPVTETEAAQALSYTAPIIKSLTYAPEGDAWVFLSYGKAVTLTPATSTEAAQALSTSKELTPAAEADAGQALSISKTVTLGINELRWLKITDLGGIAGTFTLTMKGQTTSPLAYDADAPTVQAALEALSNVDPGDIDVDEIAKGAGETLSQLITFQGQYGRQDITTSPVTGFSFDSSGLSDASLSLANLQQGSNGAETDAAQALDYGLASGPINLTPATSAEAAQALIAQKAVDLTAGAETDAAQAPSFDKSVALVAATETDEAQALTTSSGPISLTPATSTEVAGGLVDWAITSATESDAAQALEIAEPSYTLTPATETDTVAALEALRITAATEADAAHTLSISQTGNTLTPVTETDAAQALSVTKTIFKAVTPATETDSAQALSVTKTIFKAVTPATGADAAHTLVFTKTILKAVTPALESDLAVSLRLNASLVAALESDLAFGLSYQVEGGGGGATRRTLLGVGS